MTLVASERNAHAADRFAASAEILGIPFAAIVEPFDNEMADYGSPLILVRPDHYVSWVGKEPRLDTTSVLARTVGS